MKQTILDPHFHRNVSNQVQKHLSLGKSQLAWLESKLLDEKYIQKLKDEFDKSKVKLTKLKDRFNDYEEKAAQYIDENPKKALAMATAAGVLVGNLWGSHQGKPKNRKKK
jgi:ElaB/YqjD/DUF883 family membrane-anchored ribosome-binding protein